MRTSPPRPPSVNGGQPARRVGGRGIGGVTRRTGFTAALTLITCSRIPAQDLPACYLVEIETPGVADLYQGDTMILTDRPVDGFPGIPEGFRAAFSRSGASLEDPPGIGSWYWKPLEDDSILIASVLPPLTNPVTWTARRLTDRLEGEVRALSDVADEPGSGSRFRARRVPCPER